MFCDIGQWSLSTYKYECTNVIVHDNLLYFLQTHAIIHLKQKWFKFRFFCIKKFITDLARIILSLSKDIYYIVLEYYAIRLSVFRQLYMTMPLFFLFVFSQTERLFYVPISNANFWSTIFFYFWIFFRNKYQNLKQFSLHIAIFYYHTEEKFATNI